ncbi:DNA damage-inducible protein 1 [Aspergillus viridinutans]|uniref:DNA damage-inducible protein 1 n=1 Tax=Aspergillus viridinutans TaxID=75553 RepID=A0A9P3BVC4_ASPVI|nr:DNA damage-inducible protein 1 [Aspergillus viridinutans]GIK02955.1 DNA damage-inducible protein 1 [Aspergillus viridinutans]
MYQRDRLGKQRLHLREFEKPEAGEETEEIISQPAVTAYLHNADNAIQEHPELEVNGTPVTATVGTGAHTTIMSPKYASKCNLKRLIDRRFHGTAKGVGTAITLGRVHSALIKVGNMSLPWSVFVVEGDYIGLHLGLDILRHYQARIDLKQNALVIQNQAVCFLAEGEIPGALKDEIESKENTARG